MDNKCILLKLGCDCGSHDLYLAISTQHAGLFVADPNPYTAIDKLEKLVNEHVRKAVYNIPNIPDYLPEDI